MSDTIELTGLTVSTCHGVLDFEKRIPQPFVLDIALEVDLQEAGRTDDLSASLSYADVAQRAVAVCTGEPVDLVETLAERVAAACLEWEQVEAADVTVHKPHAPAGVLFTGSGTPGPAVRIRRERSREAVVALGTNLGRRVATLREAVEALRRLDGFEPAQVSPIVETDPVGGIDQPAFLNAVVVGTTRLAADHLIRELHAIERRHGRRRDVRWGPRTLDLDLVQLGTPGTDDEVRRQPPGGAAADASSSPLALPHPRAVDRAFVLAPWAEAAPWARLRTVDGIAEVTDLLEALDLSGVRPGPDWEAVEPYRSSRPVPGHEEGDMA